MDRGASNRFERISRSNSKLSIRSFPRREDTSESQRFAREIRMASIRTPSDFRVSPKSSNSRIQAESTTAPAVFAHCSSEGHSYERNSHSTANEAETRPERGTSETSSRSRTVGTLRISSPEDTELETGIRVSSPRKRTGFLSGRTSLPGQNDIEA